MPLGYNFSLYSYENTPSTSMSARLGVDVISTGARPSDGCPVSAVREA